MTNLRCWLTSLLLVASFAVFAQDATSFLSPSDSTNLTATDSLSVFQLIDSLLQLDITPGDQLAIRLSYNSNVLSAGRTLGIQNFGLAPGISYYHKSGLYADASTYWSKDFTPSWYLSIASAGYMHDFSKRFSIMAGYDHYFYNVPKDAYIPYRNALSLAPTLEFKPVTFTLNYSFYFGDKQAHRIMPGLSVRLQKKKWLGLNRIALSPSMYALFGNETFTEIQYPETIRELLRRQKKGLPLYDEVNKNVFGIMNYAFSLPLSAGYKNFSLLFTYTYNIPKALPGEPLTISNNHYLSGSVMYILDLKRHKKPLLN